MREDEQPIAYFLTWATYGTWLPGDERGWHEYRRGWKPPDPIRKLEAEAKMTAGACILSPAQRAAVEAQVAETCAHRGWQLHAVNCRSNHVHVVVTASDTSAEKTRAVLKAYTTRRLRREFDASREKWWGERGSIGHVYDEETLECVITYVREAQDRKGRDATELVTRKRHYNRFSRR